MFEHVLAVFVFSLLFNVVVLLLFERSARARGFVAKDMNKFGERSAVKCVALIPSLTLAVIFSVVGIVYHLNFALFLAPILYLNALGFFDDVLPLKQSVKMFLTSLAALFITPYTLTIHTIDLGPLGVVDVGKFYALLLVPVAFTGVANVVNMLAGYNGLEAGVVFVILFFITLNHAFHGVFNALLISVVFLALLLAFLFFNKFPARVFPGDSGTLTFGGFIVVSVLLGRNEFYGAVLTLPYLLDFVIKAWHKFPGDTWAQPLPDGRLAVKKVKGLIHFFITLHPWLTREWRVVTFTWAVFGLWCVLVSAVFWFFGWY
jgi:UDP-N-acetylglucosamine--dolichyl-phosphate N-acetylglucosaminephosphotransferase